MHIPDELTRSTLKIVAADAPAASFVEVPTLKNTQALLANEVCIDTIHEGKWLPESFANIKEVINTAREGKLPPFIKENDWGADQVAYLLAQKLGLPGFSKVNVPRALMDFGRFPGVTKPEGFHHLDRLAINLPAAEHLSFLQKREVLKYYDRTSEVLEKSILGKNLKISVHTYDTHNPAPPTAERTRRPKTSLIYSPKHYLNDARMPYGVFDPLYVDELSEFTADRKLVARMALTLEKELVPVGLNQPYSLPDGSVEVRSQVWNFFDFLQSEFTAEFPEIAADEAYVAVWHMLKDTNFRSGEAEVFRSYIHYFRPAPRGTHFEKLCPLVLEAYEEIGKYLKQNRRQIISRFKFNNPKRLSALVLEVRKDCVWDFRTMQPRWDEIERYTTIIARGIARYFAEDKL